MAVTVLLADRLRSLHESLAAALTERGLDVLHADSHEKALGLADQADVVLLDRDLTEREALDTIESLREQARTSRIPVIVHTSRKDSEYDERAGDAGATDVIRRPFDYEALLGRITELGGRPAEQTSEGGRPTHAEEPEVVRFLAAVLEQRLPTVQPRYDPDVPLGYAYPTVQEKLELDGSEALQLLEGLEAEGFLDARLADKVHLCPACGWHTLNFVEVCPRCRGIDIGLQQVIHHFSCAYVGPISEFRQGVDLVCPKCDEQLRHMGLDYEKPSDTYVCNECRHVFTESEVEAHCLRCGHVTPAAEVRPTRVNAFTATRKADRAAQYGRLHGLDIHSVLFEDRSRTFRRDYLTFEIGREIYRARRYGTPLSLVLLSVEGIEEAAGEAASRLEAESEVFEAVAEELRDLDVVSALQGGMAAVLLPETNLDAAVHVAERVRDLIVEFQSVNMEREVTVTAAVGALLEEHEEGMEFFEYVHQALLWTLRNRPGTVVSATTWKEEAADA
ncbi:MAG: response regulator [Candidatus Brocadiia bacterium]